MADFFYWTVNLNTWWDVEYSVSSRQSLVISFGSEFKLL